MTPIEVAGIMFPLFIVLVILRIPVAIALGLACVPIFLIEDRLTPFLLMNEAEEGSRAISSAPPAVRPPLHTDTPK